MSDEDKRFSHESLQDAKTIKTLLTALSKGLSKGQVALGDEDDELILKTDGLMNLRLKGAREDGHCSVSLRITWTDPEAPPQRKDKPRIDS